MLKTCPKWRKIAFSSIFKRVYLGFGVRYDLPRLSDDFYWPNPHFLKFWGVYTQKAKRHKSRFFQALVREYQAGAPMSNFEKSFSQVISDCSYDGKAPSSKKSPGSWEKRLLRCLKKFPFTHDIWGLQQMTDISRCPKDKFVGFSGLVWI